MTCRIALISSVLAILLMTAFFGPLSPQSLAQVARRDTVLADPLLEARAQALMQTLRCQVCSGQSVLESAAPHAADLRAFVREGIANGDTDQDLRNHLTRSYGSEIHMLPELKEQTYFLWFGPLVFVLFGLWLAGRFLRFRHRATPKR